MAEARLRRRGVLPPAFAEGGRSPAMRRFPRRDEVPLLAFGRLGSLRRTIGGRAARVRP